jgi:myxalamid-type polyketide synthase MxaE and MxaD
MASAGNIGGMGEMLAVAEGLNAFAALLASPSPQVGVARVDWSLFKPVYQGRSGRRLLDEIDVPSSAPEPSAMDEHPFHRLVREAPPATARGLVTACVAEAVARALGFDASETIDPRQGFFKLGMDSITTVRLGLALEARLGCRLPRTVAFEYPTIEALAAFALKTIAPSEDPRATAAPLTAPIASVLPEHLSEEELTALLTDKLKEPTAVAVPSRLPNRNR